MRAAAAPLMVLALAVALVGPAAADDVAQLPAPLQEIRFAPPLGERLPGDVLLRDTRGPVRVAELLGERPLLLVPVWHECPMLCSMVLDGLQRALRPLELRPGVDLDIAAFSFVPDEPPERAAAARAAFVEQLGGPVPAHGVRFLTGSAEPLARLTAALGFAPARDPRSDQWAHAAGLVLASPDGTLTRFLSGVEFAPRDLRLAVAEASRGEVRSLADSVLLYCYRWDAARGRYGAAVMNLVRAGGALTVLLLAVAVLRARRLRPGDPDGPHDPDARGGGDAPRRDHPAEPR